MQTGYIFDIKKYAVHDGPGIRTTVFFKGCPLSCLWCHNPESLSPKVQRIYRVDRCMGCMECVTACPNDALSAGENRPEWTPSHCVQCRNCLRVCPAEAVEFVGNAMAVDDVLEEIEKDALFYDESGGGVTFSGGEPLMQPSFLKELLQACGRLDLHRTVDTCGYADADALLEIAAHTELFLFDLKHMDPDKHFRYTGVSNERILPNLQRLTRQGAEVIIRLPLIPGINSDRENIMRTGEFISGLAGVHQVNILPYHGAARAKYDNLGLTYKAAHIGQPDRGLLESTTGLLKKYGLQVKIGG